MTLERCPPSAWNRVRHRVEYADISALGESPVPTATIPIKPKTAASAAVFASSENFCNLSETYGARVIALAKFVSSRTYSCSRHSMKRMVTEEMRLAYAGAKIVALG